MFREGRRKSEPLSSLSELGPAHAVGAKTRQPFYDVTIHGAMVFVLFILKLAEGIIAPSFIHGYQQWTGVGPVGSGHYNMSCLLLFFACSLLLSLTHLFAAAAAAVFMETPKMCQKPLISRAPLQRRCFSLGAGNVVYHHQLLYVRNWVVSGWDMIFSWGWFGEGARWIGVLVHWQNYGKQCETLLVYCSVYIFFNFYEKKL